MLSFFHKRDISLVSHSLGKVCELSQHGTLFDSDGGSEQGGASAGTQRSDQSEAFKLIVPYL